MHHQTDHAAAPRARARHARRARRALTLVVSLATLAASPAAGTIAALGAQPSDTSRVSTSPLFTNDDAWVAGAFALGTVAMFPLDRYFARRLQTPGAQERRLVRQQATNLRLIGEPGTLIIGASMFALGRATGNERMADLGLHGTEAIGVGLLTTGVLKALAGRQRPYMNTEEPYHFKLFGGWRNRHRMSFPSGHTTMGFAAAASVTAETARWWPEYDWLIGTAMYGGAALIGASRMYDNKHWASDVVMGAAIGTFAGRKVVRYHHSHPDNRIDRWLLGARITPTNEGKVVRLILAPGRRD